MIVSLRVQIQSQTRSFFNIKNGKGYLRISIQLLRVERSDGDLNCEMTWKMEDSESHFVMFCESGPARSEFSKKVPDF